MRLPLYAPEPEPVPSCVAEAERVALPNVLALVDAGHPEALDAFVRAIRDIVAPLRVLTVTDAASAAELATTLGDVPAITIGAAVPARFKPACTLAFTKTQSRASYPAAAREVRERMDATLPEHRPALARHLAETLLSPAKCAPSEARR